MKLTTTILILFVCLSGYGQNKARCINFMIDAVVKDSAEGFRILRKDYFKSLPTQCEYYRLMVGDKYLYIDADSNMVITDSAKAIHALLIVLLSQYNQLYKKQKN